MLFVKLFTFSCNPMSITMSDLSDLFSDFTGVNASDMLVFDMSIPIYVYT
jgi:hypothetical protein